MSTPWSVVAVVGSLHAPSKTDTPMLAASERHSLILEHQLRPLFGFSQVLTLPLIRSSLGERQRELTTLAALSQGEEQ